MEKMSLNREQIMEIIPHRDPMLLVDEVTELVPGKSITAKFYVSPDREIFKGHFPGDPILPGVYVTESTAQALGLILMTLPEYKGMAPLLLGIANASFKKKTVPGDTLVMKGEITKAREDKAIYTAAFEVTNGGEVCAVTEVTIAMR